MLVLSRRIGEDIVIAGNIRVTVIAANGQRVRLGITAPVSVSVARQELLAGRSLAAGTPTAGTKAQAAPPTFKRDRI